MNVAFSLLFAFTCVQEAWVGDVWSVEQGKRCRNPILITIFNNWKMEDVDTFVLSNLCIGNWTRDPTCGQTFVSLHGKQLEERF